MATLSIQRVAVLTSTRSSFGRRILKGVSTYTRPTRSWRIRIGSANQDRTVEQLRSWQPTGIIAHLGDASILQQVVDLNVPVVNVSNGVKRTNLPHVGIDDVAVGRMAAGHLVERGFHHFAYCGDPTRGYAQDRRDGFRQVIADAGRQYHEFDWPVDSPRFAEAMRSAMDTDVEEHFSQWLLSLPKPVGILVFHDYLGFALCEVCRQLGVGIPDQIAMIGVDDDEMACEFAYPPISSVRSPLEQVGYEAAQLLDWLMDGGVPPSEPTLLLPSAVTVRQSTEVTATDDPELAAALRFIRKNADKPIQVEDVLEAVGVSRRTLEMKFKRLLHRSPLAEIHRVHVEQVKRLLTETQLSIPRVAESSGFSSTTQMNVVFRRSTGMAPSDYRRSPK